ncbi:zf-HC2 domain-containing protein [Sphaerisporangium sp. TRM90804]|uniref:anti-sigma factor family protein n=1 Tax=Sphaerisporangium sp. TRM90804 TaxID=3031113 RepID=UPI002449CB85|nr:zf-HC2 domain-containing protein [Sphaerisporangium sp. TRM90804]MDH2427145.1 zf-HC2 domain-containing protein [Sphaerisporangium sp. TRM90804]
MNGLMESPPHVEVAAYILGVLNKEDSEAFDRHLLECASCQNELREMYDLPDALNLVKRSMKGQVNGTARGVPNGAAAPRSAANGFARGVTGGPSPDEGVVRDLWPPRPRERSGGHRRVSADPPPGGFRDELAEARRQARRRSVTWLGVAAALVIGVTGVATAHLWPGPGPGVSVAAPAVSGAPEVREGEGPAKGVSGSVGMVRKSWGTEVQFKLSGVTGPERCSLVAVSRTGDTDIVSGWSVPPGKGFGVPGFPAPLSLTGGTALARTDIVRFEVRRDDGVRLLDIPVA